MLRKLIVILVLAVVSAGVAAVQSLFVKKTDKTRLIAMVVAWGILIVGWLFIFWQNSFHATTPVVIVALAYVAVVATVFNLWRTGAAAVEPNEEDDGDASWGLPIGARGELEREKKTLLKAIKEAEFDHQMGKLSKADADSMIKTFRVRAIEVIKEIERFDGGAAGSVRERIEREVRARLELEAAVDKGAAAVKQAKKDRKKQRGADRKSEPKAATAVEASEASPPDAAAASESERLVEEAATAADTAGAAETAAAAERAAVVEAEAEAAVDGASETAEAPKSSEDGDAAKASEAKKPGAKEAAS